MPGRGDVSDIAANVPATMYAVDFSAWKRRVVRQCFPQSRIEFVSSIAGVPESAWLIVWGMRDVPQSVAASSRILRLEDGFLRSVGLGADLIRPMSWTVDGRGIYYDATRPSDLEELLATTAFDGHLLARAHALRERIVGARLTKYNVGSDDWEPPSAAKRLILVPGQVESDASLAFGAPGIRRNMDLLRIVREANPNAYVIYKPHPDVAARLRAPGEAEHEAARWCDELVVDTPMARLLDTVHEVHVMTSLTGFEALLRGKAVTCHGQPFYAGWGLTSDALPPVRRRRLLTLDELIAGALILYPLYFDRHGKGLVSPEVALGQLVEWRAEVGGRTPWWRGLFRAALRTAVGVR